VTAIQPAGLRPASRDGLAVGLVLLSSLLFVLGYALSKSLIVTFGLTSLQVTFLRCAVVLAAVFAMLPWPRTGVTWQRIWHPPRAWEQRVAAAALMGSVVLSVIAFGLLPVTIVTSLGFTAPLLLTAFSGLVLKEHVTLNRWLATGIGFGGMLLIVQPGAAPLSWGTVAALGSAFAYAGYQLIARRLRAVASSLDTVVQLAVMGVVTLAGAMAVFWRPLSAAAFGVLLLATLILTVALFCIAAALRRGEASRLAPWQFSGLLWAMLLDWLMFDTLPSVASGVGGVLILAGGFLAGSSRVRSNSAVLGGRVRVKPP
jgi:drug/metabolite transporter (DMT)-like permease